MMKHITRRGTALGAVAGLLVIGFFACSKQPAEQSGDARKTETQSPGVKPFTTEELNRRTIERRAVDAAIWGMPIVNFDVMRQAFFRDANAAYGDIMFWSRPANWKLQCLTPNTSVRYVFSFINTSQPVVLELPARGDTALMGTVIDAWQVPVTDLGLAGEGEKAPKVCAAVQPTQNSYRARPNSESTLADTEAGNVGGRAGNMSKLPPAETERWADKVPAVTISCQLSIYLVLAEAKRCANLVTQARPMESFNWPLLTMPVSEMRDR